MPHDKNGAELKVGDVVTVEATVKELSTGVEFCNIQLETVDPMYPGNAKTGLGWVNAKQVVKKS